MLLPLTIVNDGRGTLHVHTVGCADLTRAKYAGGSRWDYAGDSERDVVLHIYEGFEDLDPAGANWRDFAGDVEFYPCCAALPAEPAAHPAIALYAELARAIDRAFDDLDSAVRTLDELAEEEDNPAAPVCGMGETVRLAIALLHAVSERATAAAS